MVPALTPDEIQSVAMERNKALWAAGWNTERGASGGVGMPRCECFEGRFDPLQRQAAIGDNPIYFTPHDRAMVWCFLSAPWHDPETRPWRIMVGEIEAKDKRGRLRKWGSSQAALREARKIEREMLSLPKRKRVGTKAAAPPPGPLLALMGEI